MNNLALSLGAEEPDVTSVAVRPGMVDTEMQRELREDHATALDAEMHSKFTGVHKDGKLLKPEQPGHVMAKLVLDAPKEISGCFYSYVLSHTDYANQKKSTNIWQMERQGSRGFPGVRISLEASIDRVHICNLHSESATIAIEQWCKNQDKIDYKSVER